jgi:hypothetical protein
MGQAGIISRLGQAFGLNEAYIYKLLAIHRKQNPDIWNAPEQLLMQPQTLHGERLMVSNAVTETRNRRSLWQRFLNKVSMT